MKFALALTASTAALAVGFGTVAHAQSAAASAETSAASNDALGDIVVTAQRREESLSRTPVSVQVLSADALQRRAITSEADLQIAVPGLTVRAGQTSNTLNYSIRGQTVDVNSSSRSSVLPYVNEVQLGGGSSKGGASASSLYDLSSLQVLKGPQGTLFGRNSTGGAVLFQTEKAGNDFGGYVTGWYGNYDDRKFEGAVNIPLVDNVLAIRAAGFYQKRDGYQVNLLDNTRLGNVDNQSGRLSISFTPGSVFRNETMIQYTRGRGNNMSVVAVDAFPAASGLGFVPGSFLYSPLLDTAFGAGSWDRFVAAHPNLNPAGLEAAVADQRTRDLLHVRLDSPNIHRADDWIVTNLSELDLSENTTLRLVLGYGHSRYANAAEYDGTEFPLDNQTAFGARGTLEQFSAEPQIQGTTFGGALKYVVGLFYASETEVTRAKTALVDLSPVAPVIIQTNAGSIKSKTYAAYGQGTLDLSEITGIEGVSITLGGRYSEERVSNLHFADDAYIVGGAPPGAVFENPLKDTFKQFSWTTGLQYQATSQLLIYATSRRSFRTGGFNFYAPPLAGFGNSGGAEFKQERATDIELGTKFNGRLGTMPAAINLAAYKMWIDDIQRSNFVSVFGALAGITVNVPQAQVYGFELDGQVSPTDWLNLGGSAVYTHAEFTDNIVSVLGNPAVAFGPYPDSPKWALTGYFDVRAPITDRLRGLVRGDAYHQTSMAYSSTANTLNPGAFIPKYTILNLRVGLEDEDAGWSISGIVKNLTDKKYAVGGVAYKSLLSTNTLVPGAPRTYVLELRYKF